jgi:CheY-specific phosphatase CheX
LTESAVYQALRDAVLEVLEKMFFLEAADEPVSDRALGTRAVTLELAFEGDPPGVFRMSLEKPAAAMIAADFLGEDSTSLTGNQVDDVARELANMICGAVLSRIESSATFRLGTPELLAGGENCRSTLQGTACTVETGSGVLTAGIAMEEKACSPTVRSAS